MFLLCVFDKHTTHIHCELVLPSGQERIEKQREREGVVAVNGCQLLRKQERQLEKALASIGDEDKRTEVYKTAAH